MKAAKLWGPGTVYFGPSPKPKAAVSARRAVALLANVTAPSAGTGSESTG